MRVEKKDSEDKMRINPLKNLIFKSK